ncbi:MAG: acyl carrier protein [Rhodocyclales bacterium]|nr:acyl carrier protein [Rhodocyclales bacterium]
MKNEDPLLQVVAEVFGLNVEEVDDSSSQDTIRKWDSLGMINLISEIELRFDVQFDLAELVLFKNVGIIRTLLLEKGVSFD